MRLSSYTTKPINELFQELRTTSDGLSYQEVGLRHKSYGLNEIDAREIHWWQILAGQFKSPFLFLLLGAAGLAFFMHELIDGSMVILFVLINAVLGFYQEYKSEAALKLLKHFIIVHSRVMREGKETTVNTNELVPGDIVLLEAGDVVPADIRLFEESNLTVDESVLTGESAVVTKLDQALPQAAKEMYQAQNLCFSGTTIITGKAKGVVIATGKNTSLGEIAHLTVETHRESSFEKGIAKFSSFILRLILITLAGIFVVNLLIKGGHADIPTLLIFSIALAVTVIPEALPVVITFSLSRGAVHLAKHNVVVKRLSAIEDLGSIEVLCTDKTGTLTENQMTIHEMYPQKNPELHVYAALASTLAAKKSHSIHSFDLALLDNLNTEEKKTFHTFSRIQENPFDPERKRSSMIVKKGEQHELIVRGAPEIMIKLCPHISSAQEKEMSAWILQEGKQGNRIIAVAKKALQQKDLAGEKDDLDEGDLTLLGMISFVDPIKPTAREAVKQARALGVQIKVLTGDSAEVAGAVAHQIDLIDDPSLVITGDAFDQLPMHKQHEVAHSYSVFARVSPEQKYRIIQLLQEKYEVGFLGEGINDAPALKIANVAIVVQGATDVAREAADIILLKRSLEIIVDGIKEGRIIFANTNKYIKATLSSNFGNFYTVAIASLFIDFLPLLPMQLLLINLLTDFPMIAVSTDNIDAEELKSPRSYDVREIALVGTLLGVVSSIFDFIFFVLFYKISPHVLQTNWFIGSVLTELLFMFSIRTKRFVLFAKPPSKIFVGLTTVAFFTAIAIPFTQIGQTLFMFVTPNAPTILLILGIVSAYFLVTETVKVVYYHYAK